MGKSRRLAVLFGLILAISFLPWVPETGDAQTPLGIVTRVRGQSGEVLGPGVLDLDLSCFFICVGSFRVVTGGSMLSRMAVGGVFLGGVSGRTAGQPVELNGLLVYAAAQDEPFPLQFPAVTPATAQIGEIGTFDVDIQYVVTVNVYGYPGTYRGPVHLELTDPNSELLRPFTVSRI